MAEALLSATDIGQIEVAFASLEGTVTALYNQILSTELKSQITGALAFPLGIRRAIVLKNVDFKAMVEDRMYFFNNLRAMTAELSKSSTIEGKLATIDQGKKLLALMQNVAIEWSELAKFAKDFSTAALAQRAFVQFAEDTAFLANAIGQTLLNIGKALKSNVDAGAKTLEWLPWIIGALILGPPLLRVIVAGREGGANAAMREGAGQLDRGRKSAREFGSKAAQAARRAAALI